VLNANKVGELGHSGSCSSGLSKLTARTWKKKHDRDQMGMTVAEMILRGSDGCSVLTGTGAETTLMRSSTFICGTIS